MNALLNDGVVLLGNDVNLSMVWIGIALVLIGLLGLAALFVVPRTEVNTADGVGKEGPASPLPLPYEEWHEPDEDAEYRQHPALRPLDQPDIPESEGEKRESVSATGECTGAGAGFNAP